MLVPAVLLGIILGPLAAKFLVAERWGSGVEGQQEAITLVSHLRIAFCICAVLSRLILVRACAVS